MLKFLSIVLLTFTTGLAIVQAADGEANRQKLIVGTREAPPFAMKDDAGVWTGLSIELWEDVAQDLGMAYELREMGEPETLIDGVSDGTIDVSIAAITVTAERAERVDFSQPYYTALLPEEIAAHRVKVVQVDDHNHATAIQEAGVGEP